MPKQHNIHSLRVCLVAVLALLTAVLGDAGQVSARHDTPDQPAGSADPCSSPTAFVKSRIAKIRGLQKSKDANTATSISAWISQLEGQKKSIDPDTVAQISELRRDADSVNELLRAGGCQTIDIDQELAKPGS